MGSFIERPRYSCALGGAIAAVTALPGAIPVVHSPGGCGGQLAWAQAGGCGLQVGGYCGGISLPGSNIQEREVVFGGTDKLQELLENTIKIMDGDLYYVLTSCVTELIGDDVGAAVSVLRERAVPVIFAETGGFKGNSYHGYDLVLKSLWENYVPVTTGKQKGRVNLWGIPPYFDVFWRGNLLGLRQLLAKLGLNVNTFFTFDDSLDEIRQAGSAELNIIVSDVFGKHAAQAAFDLHGIPYINTPLPVGPSTTAAFLQEAATALALPSPTVEKLIEQETRRYYQILEPLTDCFTDIDLQRYAAVIGDANYATGITTFLADDLGWLPEVVAVTDVLTEEEQLKVEQRLTSLESKLSPKVLFNTDTSAIRKEIAHYWANKSSSGKYANPPNPAFVVGSSLDRELAKDLNAAHLSISFPVANRAVLDRSYTCFNGGLRLVEDLLSAIIVNR